MVTVIIAAAVMGIIGALFGVFLSVSEKLMHVAEDPLIAQITEILPGINCGACGEVGCRSFAKLIVKNRSLGTGCRPGGADVGAKISTLLGLDHLGSDRVKVICRCGAKGCDQKRSSEYRGPQSCAVAHASGGVIDCRFGCMGLGDCVRVCPVGALSIVDGHVEVDNHLCIDCGRCVKACPRGLFQFADIGTDTTYAVVRCANRETGAETKKVCSAGCIACGICTRIIPESPFLVEDNVARLDYRKARGRDLSAAVEKCPSKIIALFKV